MSQGETIEQVVKRYNSKSPVEKLTDACNERNRIEQRLMLPLNYGQKMALIFELRRFNKYIEKLLRQETFYG